MMEILNAALMPVVAALSTVVPIVAYSVQRNYKRLEKLERQMAKAPTQDDVRSLVNERFMALNDRVARIENKLDHITEMLLHIHRN